MRAVQELVIFVWMLGGFVLLVWAAAQSIWLGLIVGAVFVAGPMLYARRFKNKKPR